MPYGECKIYFDGSHYIGIPHTTRPSRRRPKPPEEEIVVTENETDMDKEQVTETDKGIQAEENAPSEIDDASSSHTEDTDMPEKRVKSRTMTRKELFEELYKKYQNEPRKKKIELITRDMSPYFRTEVLSRNYVMENVQRKVRNIIARRIRLTRKVNLQDFNYFCTVTYFYGHFCRPLYY